MAQRRGKFSFRNLTKSQLGGVVFGCTKNTIKECMSKQLFGESSWIAYSFPMLVFASAECSCLFAVYFDSLLAHCRMLLHFFVSKLYFAMFVCICFLNPLMVLTGLPSNHYPYVQKIDIGLPLFLFNYSDRTLHGIFEAAGCGQLNFDPYGWTSDGSERTSYPAQVPEWHLITFMNMCFYEFIGLHMVFRRHYPLPTFSISSINFMK